MFVAHEGPPIYLFLTKFLLRQHRISIKKYMGEGSVSMRVEKVFALLIESGFVYCCLWVCSISEQTGLLRTHLLTSTYYHTAAQILYLISAFRVFPEPGFTVMDSVLLFTSVSRAGEYQL